MRMRRTLEERKVEYIQQLVFPFFKKKIISGWVIDYDHLRWKESDLLEFFISYSRLASIRNRIIANIR